MPKTRSQKKKPGVMPKAHVPKVHSTRSKAKNKNKKPARVVLQNDCDMSDGDGDEMSITKKLASTLLALQNENMTGTSDNQDAWEGTATAVAACIFEQFGDGASLENVEAIIRPLFMTEATEVKVSAEQRMNFEAELKKKYDTLTDMIKRNGPGIPGHDGIVEHIVTLESILGYAAPGADAWSLIFGQKSWSPEDAVPEKHLETKGDPVSLPPSTSSSSLRGSSLILLSLDSD